MAIEDRECAPAHQHETLTGAGTRGEPNELCARDAGFEQVVEQVVEEDTHAVQVAEGDGEVMIGEPIMQFLCFHAHKNRHELVKPKLLADLCGRIKCHSEYCVLRILIQQAYIIDTKSVYC